MAITGVQAPTRTAEKTHTYCENNPLPRDILSIIKSLRVNKFPSTPKMYIRYLYIYIYIFIPYTEPLTEFLTLVN